LGRLIPNGGSKLHWKITILLKSIAIWDRVYYREKNAKSNLNLWQLNLHQQSVTKCKCSLFLKMMLTLRFPISEVYSVPQVSRIYPKFAVPIPKFYIYIFKLEPWAAPGSSAKYDFFCPRRPLRRGLVAPFLSQKNT
jgi:hypothetical protein